MYVCTHYPAPQCVLHPPSTHSSEPLRRHNVAATGPSLFEFLAPAEFTLPALVDVVRAAAVVGPAVLTPQCSDKRVQLNCKVGRGKGGGNKMADNGMSQTYCL